MRYNPDVHHRRSIRLQGYDYAQMGAYFVTICVHNRECLLGDVVEGAVLLSEVGKTIGVAWEEIPMRFPFVLLETYVLMHNHLHGIIMFTDRSDKTGLGKILRVFKSLSAIQANRMLDRAEQPFWQRNYYERIIRDEEELEQIRTYILHNPAQWENDTENPYSIKTV